jgi:hypothetical protein
VTSSHGAFWSNTPALLTKDIQRSQCAHCLRDRSVDLIEVGNVGPDPDG